MSSLKAHGAEHMAGFMPKPMQDIGTGMHRAASRFALKAQEGELAPALASLQEVTAACVACHAGYRIR
jgi:cytochrome c556